MTGEDVAGKPYAMVAIWSGEHRAYWRRGETGQGHGYTIDPLRAGKWARADAEMMTAHCGPEKLIALHDEARDFYADRYAERSGDVARLQGQIAAMTEPLRNLAGLWESVITERFKGRTFPAAQAEYDLAMTPVHAARAMLVEMEGKIA